jgi:hypothetical protein
MLRALFFALLVVGVSVGVFELSARTQTSDNLVTQGFRADSATYGLQLASESPLLPSVSR